MNLPVTAAHYAVFILLILGVLLIERKFRPHVLTWIAVAGLFAVWLSLTFGRDPALSFLTGYIVELALSVDNLLVFVVIFTFFSVPAAAQRRALTYGIIGAIVMRAIFIAIGATLVQSFHWVMYILGALLLVTAYKLGTEDLSSRIKPENNLMYRLFSKIVPSVNQYDADRFFTVVEGSRRATPLFFVVLIIESTDLVFAIDSIPAIFGITQDPFLVFTSNVFAVIGLRSLYTVVSDAIGSLRFLKTGLTVVLGYIGLEMLLSGYIHVPIEFSLGIVVAVLLVSAGLSKLFPS